MYKEFLEKNEGLEEEDQTLSVEKNAMLWTQSVSTSGMDCFSALNLCLVSSRRKITSSEKNPKKSSSV